MIAKPALLLPIATVMLFSQTSQSSLTFDVASVKKREPGGSLSATTSGGPGEANPEHLRLGNVSLSNLIELAFPEAYRHEIFGIPNWAQDDRYDIAANVPAGAKRNDTGLMIRALLQERFQLRAHTEKREMPAYRLVVAKGGTKLQRPSSEDLNAGRVITGLKGISMQNIQMPMPFFVNQLSQYLQRRVFDETGLSGIYEFTIDYQTPRQEVASPQTVDDVQFPSVFTALEEKLGLKLENSRVITDVVVIDHIDRVPSEN